MRALTEKQIASPKLIGELVSFAKDAMPLLEWGWAAVVEER